MERPTTKGGYTKHDLEVYARYRADKELKCIADITEGEQSKGETDNEQPTERQDNENYREPLSVYAQMYAERYKSLMIMPKRSRTKGYIIDKAYIIT